MEIRTHTTTTDVCHIDLAKDEKFAHKRSWWSRTRWVNHIHVECDSFLMYGSTDPDSDQLQSIYRDRWQNVHFTSTDEVPGMPYALRVIIEEKRAILWQAELQRHELLRSENVD